jgi:hypothetical protein
VKDSERSRWFEFNYANSTQWTNRDLPPSSVLHKRELDAPLKHEPPTKKLKPEQGADYEADKITLNTNVDGDLYFTNGSAHKTGTSRNLTPSSVLHKRDLDTPLKHEPPTKKLKPDYEANMIAVDVNIDGEHLCSTNGNHHKAELRSCDSTSTDPDIDLLMEQ